MAEKKTQTEESGADRSGQQSGGDRRWEQVGELVDDTPEAAGKLGRGVPNRDPEIDDPNPDRETRTQIDKNVDKDMEKV